MKPRLSQILAFVIAWSAALNGQEVTLELPSSPPEFISVNFPDNSVFEIIESVSREFSLDVEIPEELREYRTSIKLRNISWFQIFHVALDPAGYTFLESEEKIEIMPVTEFDALPLVEFKWEFIFVPIEEFLCFYDDDLPLEKERNERIKTEGSILTIECHPSNLPRWKEIIRSADTPMGLPRYPIIYWPEEIPKSIETKKRMFPVVFPSPHPESIGTSVYVVNWTDPKLLKEKVSKYLSEDGEVIRIDKRSSSLVITAREEKMKTILNACDYLDQRRWYTERNLNQSGDDNSE